MESKIEQPSCYWLYAAGVFMLGLKSPRVAEPREASEAGLGQVAKTMLSPTTRLTLGVLMEILTDSPSRRIYIEKCTEGIRNAYDS